MIYFIQAEGGGPIKIGNTVQLSARLRQLCKETGSTLRVLAVVDGGSAQESALHRRFAHLRAFGEWFEPGDDLLGFVLVEARAWDGTDDRNDVPVKIDAGLIRDAKLIAASLDISLAEYLSQALRPIVARDLAQTGADLIRRAEALRPKKNGG